MTLTPDSDKPEQRNLTRRNVLRAAGALGAAGTIPATVAAAEGNESATSSTTPTPEPNEVSIELSKTLIIESWTFEGGAFRVTFEADIPHIIKISDTGAVMQAMTEGDGSTTTEIPSRGYTLGSGKTTVVFQAVNFNGVSAITVASTDGAVLLRTDSVEMSRPAIKYGTVQGMIAASIGLTAGGTYKYVKGKREKEEHNHERII
jgi:hypothetical protein